MSESQHGDAVKRAVWRLQAILDSPPKGGSASQAFIDDYNSIIDRLEAVGYTPLTEFRIEQSHSSRVTINGTPRQLRPSTEFFLSKVLGLSNYLRGEVTEEEMEGGVSPKDWGLADDDSEG